MAGDGAAAAFERAIQAALDVYYFPGMWAWDRAIVRPLALRGFERTIGGDADLVAEGEVLLQRYFDWAQVVDDFVPVRVATDFDVAVPDPQDPSHDLATPSGQPIRYTGRVDLLVADADNSCWIVEHRLVDGPWANLDDLLLEERASSFCWAWELFFLGMKVAGVIYAEVQRRGAAARLLEPDPAPAAPAEHRRIAAEASMVPEGVYTRELRGAFRRTRVPLSREELVRRRDQLAYESLDMVAENVRVYPNPTPDHCGPCPFRGPCLAPTVGHDRNDVLRRSYRARDPEAVVEGRLGGVTWAMGRGAAPPVFRRDRDG